jgi:hypothetical protein
MFRIKACWSFFWWACRRLACRHADPGLGLPTNRDVIVGWLGALIGKRLMPICPGAAARY